MPYYFRLIDKATGEAGVFNSIDAELCQHFGEPCDPERFLGGWYLVIGTLIAVRGLRLGSDELRCAIIDWYDPLLVGKENADCWALALLDIEEWLAARYRSDAWASR